MPSQNWGDLLKSAVDSEKVEEAITRIVEAHDADETSHLEIGESLQSHKGASIIDHIARSVYRDKLAFDRFQIDEHLSTIDAWTKSPGVNLDAIGQMSLTTTGVLNNTAYAYLIPGDSAENAGSPTANPIWEARIKIGQTTNQEIYFGQLDPTIPNGYGFKISGNTLYAVYYDQFSEEQLEELTNPVIQDWHKYRCEYESGVSIKFYIDDTLVYTQIMDLPEGFAIFHYLSIKNTGISSRIMYLQSLHYDEDYTQ